MRNKFEIRLKQKLEDHLESDDGVNTKNVFTCTKRDRTLYDLFHLLHYIGLVMIACFSFTKEQI